jgi:hypothetical protein
VKAARMECDDCYMGLKRWQDPVTSLWVHEPHPRERGPNWSPTVCKAQAAVRGSNS